MVLPPDISEDAIIFDSQTAPRQRPIATPSKESFATRAIFFIPRCFGVKDKVIGSALLIIVLIFVIAGLMIVFDQAQDAITANPLPKEIPFRRDLPNIP